MTIVDIKTKQPVRENPLDTQLEYTRMEIDFARDRELLADAIFRNHLKHYRFVIGDDLHPNLSSDERCAMCGGRMAPRGAAYAACLPESLGGMWRPFHVNCWLGASDWMKE